MSEIWHGQHIFLWQVEKVENGDPEAIAEKAKELGLTGVLVKAHDGGENSTTTKKYWDQFEKLAPILKEKGLTVGAWGYVYGENTEGEADMAIRALETDADWYIINAEKEFKKKPEQAKKLVNRIKSQKPNSFVAFTSFDIPQYHMSFPYYEFAKKCDLWMPQVYWHHYNGGVTARWKKAEEGYNRFILKYDILLMPMGQCHSVTPDEMKEFVKITNSPGIAWWSWQDADEENLQAIKEIAASIAE